MSGLDCQEHLTISEIKGSSDRYLLFDVIEVISD
jgi:hypothetical protein